MTQQPGLLPLDLTGGVLWCPGNHGDAAGLADLLQPVELSGFGPATGRGLRLDAGEDRQSDQPAHHGGRDLDLHRFPADQIGRAGLQARV